MNGMDIKKENSSISQETPKIEQPTTEKATEKEKVVEEVDKSLEEPYTDVRTVTIGLVKNYSLFRRVNDKVLDKRRDYIGSSIESSRILSSNRRELELYFPALVGVDFNNPEFTLRVKKHLNNIRIAVDDFGKTFDISFYYRHKKDYLAIAAQEEEINKAYNAINRSDINALRKGLKLKIELLNKLESSKCELGYPINIDDYIMFRHCLLYNDVAKDLAFINIDKNVRFYFKDDKKEEEKLTKFRQEVTTAKSNYVKCIADDELFQAVYIQYCVLQGLPIISSLAEKAIDKEIKLDKFSAEEPIKFNKICKDVNVKLKSNIELLIAKGELIRSPYNQNITDADGNLIGGNMNEAVAWFNNPENNSVVKNYFSRLKHS